MASPVFMSGVEIAMKILKWIRRNGFGVEPVKYWYLYFYWNPRVWGFDFHRNQPCCKWWLCVGPFEINRVWSDEDVYHFDDEVSVVRTE